MANADHSHRPFDAQGRPELVEGREIGLPSTRYARSGQAPSRPAFAFHASAAKPNRADARTLGVLSHTRRLQRSLAQRGHTARWVSRSRRGLGRASGDLCGFAVAARCGRFSPRTVRVGRTPIPANSRMSCERLRNGALRRARSTDGHVWRRAMQFR